LLFIGFKSGLISFFYSIWIEGSGKDGYRGDLHKLAQYVDPYFNEKTYYKVICAETLEEAHYIIDQIFKMLTEFTELFRQRVRDIEV